MKHRIYLLLLIILPLFVGFEAIFEIIKYLSNNEMMRNPIFSIVLAIVGISTGIRNLWSLIKKSERSTSNTE